jgi:hypothetical protein
MFDTRPAQQGSEWMTISFFCVQQESEHRNGGLRIATAPRAFKLNLNKNLHSPAPECNAILLLDQKD